MLKEATAVVIGGGCMGASIAYNLAKMGEENVLLVERTHIAWGATGRSTAIVRQHYSNEVTARMALEGLKFFQSFERETGLPTGFRQTGFVLVANDAQAEGLRQNVDMQKGLGIKTRLLNPAELRSLQPEANVKDVSIAAYEEDSGYADPVETTRSLAEAARKLGVDLIEGTTVTGVKVASGKVTAVETSAGTIKTDKVVNAGNVWANKVLENLGITLPITAVREQNCQFMRPAGFRSPIPVWGDLIQAIYFRPQGADRIVVGSLETDLPTIADPDLMQEGVDYSTVQSFAAKLMMRFPSMSDGSWERGWSGPYDVTPDWHPILDEWPKVEGLYIAAGFSGHGFKLCSPVGRMMASLIREGKKPPGMEIFNAKRFDEGKLIQARYEQKIIS